MADMNNEQHLGDAEEHTKAVSNKKNASKFPTFQGRITHTFVIGSKVVKARAACLT